MTDEPQGARWVAEDAVPEPPVVEAVEEFARDGQVKLDDYVEGLRREFAQATDEARGAIKAELDRVTGRRSLETADAPKVTETA